MFIRIQLDYVSSAFPQTKPSESIISIPTNTSNSHEKTLEQHLSCHKSSFVACSCLSVIVIYNLTLRLCSSEDLQKQKQKKNSRRQDARITDSRITHTRVEEGSACPQTYGSISVCQQMAELQPQPQMKMAIRGPIPFSILGNKDPSRGYEPVLEKASGPCACNTSVNMHPEGILLSVLLQVHAAISLSFLATHTLAAWSRCLRLPGIRWFIVTSHFPDSSQVCIAFLYHKLVVSSLTCCEMTPHSYKTHQTSSEPQMHFQNGNKGTFIYIISNSHS